MCNSRQWSWRDRCIAGDRSWAGQLVTFARMMAAAHLLVDFIQLTEFDLVLSLN